MKTKAVEQNFIGMTGNTSVTEVKENGSTKFVLTNNKVLSRFNFVQEYLDEDTAWDRAKDISRFEEDFANAFSCVVNEDDEIELCVTGKNSLQVYQLFHGKLWKKTLGLGLRVVKPHKTFRLPEQARECVDYINSKIHR
jgi:hypothetical protein